MFHYSYDYKRKFKRAARMFLSAMLSVIYLTGASVAQTPTSAGNLDPSFDGDGKVVTALENPDTIAGAVAVQPDGKIVIAGLTGTIETDSKVPGSADFIVLRYDPNGSLDPSFGAGGKTVTSFGDGEDGAGKVLVQPDGKILVAGAINTKTPAGAVALARYLSDGSLDPSFDADGKLTTAFAELQNVDERAEALILQPDGKILVLVSTVKPNFLEDQVFVVRYNADGSRDNSFSGDGIASLPFAIPSGSGGNVVQGLAGSDLALQPDGRIIVAGTVSTSELSDVFLWRINADGSDDQTFGGRAVTVSFNRSDSAVSVFLQPNNKIFLAGATFNDTTFRNDFAFARFNANGSLDTTFDGDGRKTTIYSNTAFTFPLDYGIQSDGKIVCVGPVLVNVGDPQTSFGVTRFDTQGNLDATFAVDGKAITNFGEGRDSAQALRIQPDGKILAAGVVETAPDSDNFNLALARYSGDATAAPRKTEFDFDGDGRADSAVFRANEGMWLIQPSGGGNAGGSYYGVRWGLPSDVLSPADYDGDGKTDIAVWRDEAGNPDKSYFYILNSSNQTFRLEQFGRHGDLPLLAGDWDGDGKADPAVYRAGTVDAPQSYFFYRPSGAPGVDFRTVFWGTPDDRPVRGDFDGDGRLDAAVFRPADGVWYILQSSNNQPRYLRWGLGTDKLVPADYDGDGKTDAAVFRDGTWHVLQSSNNQPRYIYWGSNTDRLAPADYDGDGRADAAIVRAGIWYLLESASGQMRVRYFGLTDDKPIPAAFLR